VFELLELLVRELDDDELDEELELSGSFI